MGNISSPLLNRWGINLFWHHFWYSRRDYNKKVQQDKLLITLINTYLIYGVELGRNPFVSATYHQLTLPCYNPSLYFRRTSVQSPETPITALKQSRVRYTSFYQARMSILRYGGWLVLVTQWFSPSKPLTFVPKGVDKNSKVNQAAVEGYFGFHLSRFAPLLPRPLRGVRGQALNYSF